MTISKLDTIDFHINASLQMIAVEANPLSVHVIVKATQELVEAVARSKSVQLRWDPVLFIKTEHLKDYRALANKAYNYFKHADRDPDSLYAGPDWKTLNKLNIITTMMNIDGYQSLGRQLNASQSQFVFITMLMYPGLFNEGFIQSLPGAIEQSELLRKEPEIATAALRGILRSQGLLPRE